MHYFPLQVRQHNSIFMTLKKLLFIFLFNLGFFAAFAQRGEIGFHATMTEYLGHLNDKNYEIYKFRFLKPGGGISLHQYLSSSLRLVEMATYNGVQYQTPDKLASVDADVFSLNVMLKYRFDNGYILKEGALFAPYFIAGGGATYLRSTYFAQGRYTSLPYALSGNLTAGGGVNIRLTDWLNLDISNTLHMPIYDGWDGVVKKFNNMYLQHSAGLLVTLRWPADDDGDGVGNKRDRCPNTPPGTSVDRHGCPNDKDGDGITDDEDKCPLAYGPAYTRGCPDRDGDGVPDVDDKCPDVKGLRRLAGCPETQTTYVEPPKYKPVPVRDRDGDGVPDDRDKCPDTYGPASNNGCPVTTTTTITTVPRKDSDGDGLTDDRDKCPYTYGPASNYGCPEIKAETKRRLEFATRGIFFETDKAIIKSVSYKMLNEVLSIINEYPDYAVRLSGHTDNVGTDSYNISLSQRRMIAVKEYLVSKGISSSRLEAIGYGESMPIATNTTAIGRAKNRRVEIELFLR